MLKCNNIQNVYTYFEEINKNQNNIDNLIKKNKKIENLINNLYTYNKLSTRSKSRIDYIFSSPEMVLQIISMSNKNLQMELLTDYNSLMMTIDLTVWVSREQIT